MAKKGLSEELKNSIIEMSLNGRLPQDIANSLKIAVSTVHHHKRLMKNEGVVFPDYRGRRTPHEVVDVEEPSTELHSFVVNGTPIIITGKPLVIKIGPKSVEVKY